MLDTAKIRDIVKRHISNTMLAVMAMLTILFLENYIKAGMRFGKIKKEPLPAFTYAPKRIPDRIVHCCKFALFPGCAERHIINEMICLQQTGIFGRLTKEAIKNYDGQ